MRQLENELVFLNFFKYKKEEDPEETFLNKEKGEMLTISKEENKFKVVNFKGEAVAVDGKLANAVGRFFRRRRI